MQTMLMVLYQLFPGLAPTSPSKEDLRETAQRARVERAESRGKFRAALDEANGRAKSETLDDVRERLDDEDAVIGRFFGG